MSDKEKNLPHDFLYNISYKARPLANTALCLSDTCDGLERGDFLLMK